MKKNYENLNYKLVATLNNYNDICYSIYKFDSKEWNNWKLITDGAWCSNNYRHYSDEFQTDIDYYCSKEYWSFDELEKEGLLSVEDLNDN